MPVGDLVANFNIDMFLAPTRSRTCSPSAASTEASAKVAAETAGGRCRIVAGLEEVPLFSVTPTEQGGES